jgi:antirestriction protein ArdC
MIKLAGRDARPTTQHKGLPMNAAQVRKHVTEQLIEAMKSGQRPWRNPWNFGPNWGAPTSQHTGKPYRGCNALTLDLTAMLTGYKSKYWNTFNNWKELGIFPRQGQKATWCLWFGAREIEVENGDGDTSKKWINTLKTFYVFNVEQCHGDRVKEFLVEEKPVDPSAINYEEFDAIIARHNITVKHGASAAFYDSRSNSVNMPNRGHFESDVEYYNVLGHELCHWAENQLKIRNPKTSRQGTLEYADFELSAEIGGSYLVRECGIPAIETGQAIANSGIYLAGWLKRLGSDDSYIFKAAGRAGRLVDFLLGREVGSEQKDKELVAV